MFLFQAYKARRVALCSFSLLSIFVLSCAKNSDTNSPIPSGDNSANILTATAPSTHIPVYEDIKSQSIQIPFAANKASVSHVKLSLRLPAGADPAAWNTSCPSDISTAQTLCTVSYSPTAGSTSLQTIFLNYSYTNSLNISASGTPIPLTYKVNSLESLSKAIPAAINLGSVAQVNVLNSNVILRTKDNKLYTSFPSLPFLNDIANYLSSPFDNSSTFAVINDKNYPSSFYRISSTGEQKKLEFSSAKDMLAKTLIGKNGIYGCGASGSIALFNSDGTSTELATLPSSSNLIDNCFIDESTIETLKNPSVTNAKPDIIYALTHDSSLATESLCAVSSETKAPTCIQLPITFSTSPIQTITANNGYIYFESSVNSGQKYIYTITAYIYDGKKITALPGFTNFSTQPVSSNFANPVYDPISNLIYIETNTDGVYTLQAINSTDGLTGNWNYTFSGETHISAPFLTTDSKVVVVGSSGKIYGFNKDGSSPFASGNQYHLYSSPGLFAQSASLDRENHLLYILSSSSQSTISSLNMDW